MGTRLFIGNLSYNVNEQELREAFTGEGIELRSVRVALDRETGRPRGFAFVETATDDGAKASIEKLSGRILQGRADHRRGGAGQANGTARPGGPGGPPRPGGYGGPPARAPGGPGGPRWAPARSRRPGGFGGPPRGPGGPAGGPPRDFGPPRGPGGFRPGGFAGASRRAAPPGRAMPHHAASAPKRSVRPAPSPRSASGATGAGTATPTTSRAGAPGEGSRSSRTARAEPSPRKSSQARPEKRCNNPPRART